MDILKAVPSGRSVADLKFTGVGLKTTFSGIKNRVFGSPSGGGSSSELYQSFSGHLFPPFVQKDEVFLCMNPKNKYNAQFGET
jgi:hypothetical protein